MTRQETSFRLPDRRFPVDRILRLLDRRRDLKTRATREKEPFASRFAILFVEIVGYVLDIQQCSAESAFWERRFMPRTLAERHSRRDSYLGGNWAGDLGPLSPGGILEREGHD